MRNQTSGSNAKIVAESNFEMMINSIRNSPNAVDQLLPLLKEQSTCYSGHSANAVSRMRGYLIYSFYITSLPECAVPYIFEELESSREPYTVAAAALALQKSSVKSIAMGDALLSAFGNIRLNDSYISFSSYYQVYPLNKPTTATREILRALSWLGSYAQQVIPALETWAANSDRKISKENICLISETISTINRDNTTIDDCCDNLIYGQKIQTSGFIKKMKQKKEIKQFILEDQEGNKMSYGDFFTGSYSLVAFFYTRCDNPLKCSLTITNLADIQNRLVAENIGTQVNIVAISYDSFYDTAKKLKIYGEARGLRYGPNVKSFRVISNFEKIKEYFDLGVNYTGEVVNRHIIELYLINESGEPIMSFEREQMKNEEILDQLKIKIVENQKRSTRAHKQFKSTIGSLGSILIPIFMLFIPKCPLCLAAYLSVLGITGVQLGPHLKFIFPILVILMSINFYFLYRMGMKRNNFLPVYFSVSGSALLIAFGYFIPFKLGLVIGLVTIFVGALFNSLPSHILSKITRQMQ
jgi:protein SCO1/2